MDLGEMDLGEMGKMDMDGQIGRWTDPIHHLSHFFYFSPKIQKSRKVIFKAIYPYT